MLARGLAVAIATLSLAACGPRGASPGSIEHRGGGAAPIDAGDPDALPADVQALVDRWERCQHWAGEEPYDAERAQEIQAGVDDSCPGNDETRAALEHKYADRPAILRRLRQLDDVGD